MIKKTLKHFGALGFVLAAALSLAPVSMQAQDSRRNDGRWDNRGYDHGQNRDWNRYGQNEWRDGRRHGREWRAWERNRDWRHRGWRDNRWDRRYRRGYIPDQSFYFGFRY